MTVRFVSCLSRVMMLMLLALLAPPAVAEPGAPAEPASEAAPTFDLVAAPAVGRLDRVTVELEVGGDLINPSDPADRTSETDAAPMSVRGKLAYDERRLTESRSARHYREAEATIKTGARGKTPRLPSDRRLIVADSDAEHVRLFAPEGPLTRDQLDLLDVMGATLGVDALLPTNAVAEGEEWSVDGPAMGRLLGLDAVGLCEVTALIDDTNAQYVRFQLAGAVHGTIDGAATEIDLRGIALFSLKKQRLTQLNLAIREDRKVGPATPGFKGVAKARIKIRPIDASEELTDAKVAGLGGADIAEGLVAFAERQGFRFQHDRDWYAAGDDRRSLVLRRVEGVDLAAQATFTVSSLSAEPSLADFESQVRASLGDGLQSLEASEQWTNAAGCRCMGIVARGAVDGVPVEWRYYQAAGPAEGAMSSERVTLAITLEPTAGGEASAGTRNLIDTLAITPKKAASTAKRRVRRRKR